MAVTREKLYGEVWAEPMTKVAARYKVSSTYLTRICKRLKVPHPGRGHWAQVEFGKGDKPAPLPDARPGDELEWSRDGEARRLPPALPSVEASSSALTTVRKRKVSHHGLLIGAREHLENAKESWWSDDFPKPRKRLLVDVVVSKSGIERALRTANKVFFALEAHGLSVVLAPRSHQWRRPHVDPKGASRSENSYSGGWTPDRPTCAYLGTVAIGLTLFELTEESAYTTVDGKKVRLTVAVAEQRRRHSYVSTSRFPTGKFVLRAYSPYPDTTWVREWVDTKPGEIASSCDEISSAIVTEAPQIVAQVKEAEARAELRQREREEQQRKWAAEEAARRRREAEQRRAQARKESFDQLVGIIRDWSFACDMEKFFQIAAEETASLGEEERLAMQGRLTQARAMFGGTEPLKHFSRWKSPEESTTFKQEDDTYGEQGRVR